MSKSPGETPGRLVGCIAAAALIHGCADAVDAAHLLEDVPEQQVVRGHGLPIGPADALAQVQGVHEAVVADLPAFGDERFGTGQALVVLDQRLVAGKANIPDPGGVAATDFEPADRAAIPSGAVGTVVHEYVGGDALFERGQGA